MKSHKLFIIAAAVCLSVAFLFGAAQAQGDLEEIIVDYCEDVAQDSTEAIDELSEARADLAACSAQFFDCLESPFGDPTDCADDVAVCQRRGLRDQLQACNEALQEFKRNTKRAETRAKVKDVEAGFVAWFHGLGDIMPTSEECLASTEAIIIECQTIIESEQ